MNNKDGTKFKIMRQMENQHGFGVALLKYNNEDILLEGFTFISLPTEKEQSDYLKALSRMTGFEVEEM